MNSYINLTFYSLKEELSLQFPYNTTIKEMMEQYAKQKSISPKSFGKYIFLIYKGLPLELNCKDKINKKFKNNDIIYIVNKGEEITIEKIVEERKNKKNNKPQKDGDTNKNDNNKNDPNKDDKNKDNHNINNYNSNNKLRNRPNKNININNINNDDKEDENKILDIKDFFLTQMVNDGLKQKTIIEKDIKVFNNNFIPINDCLKGKDDQLFILGILGKYLERIGISVNIVNNSNLQNEYDEKYNRKILQLICNYYLLKYKYILDFELKKDRIKELIKVDNAGYYLIFMKK